MKGICEDGPAQGWEGNLPTPAPRTLLMPRDIEDYLPGAAVRDIPPGTEFPKMPGSYGYRLDRLDPAEHATVPGATEAAACYVYDVSLDGPDGYIPSMETWIYREQPVGLRS